MKCSFCGDDPYRTGPIYVDTPIDKSISMCVGCLWAVTSKVAAHARANPKSWRRVLKGRQ